MRKELFPFSHFRDYGQTPEQLPDIDIESIQKLDEELESKKLIIVDDLTGSYRYNPPAKYGLYSYTGYYDFVGEMKRIDTKPSVPVIDVLLDVESKSRQVLHRAETLQKSLGEFIFHSLRRERALDASLKDFSESYILKDRTKAIHSAESITEIGHCMLRPFTGTMPSPTSSNAKYSIEMAQDVQDFGLFAAENPEALETAGGYTLMLFAYREQKRRIAQYQPRYDLVVKEYGVLQTDLDLSQPLNDNQLFTVKFE